MKILRKLRRKRINVIILFVLAIILVMQTYAWFYYKSDNEIGSLSASVSEWDAKFFADDEEIIENEYIIEIEDFYPGVDSTDKKIDIYNIGSNMSNLEYEFESINIFGHEIVNLDTIGEFVKKEDDEGNEYKEIDLFGNKDATIFDEENMDYPFYLQYPTPFKLTCSYNKDEMGVEGDEAIAWFNLHFEWQHFDKNNVEDTKLGNLAYQYYKDNPEDSSAIKIKLKIIARKGEKVKS